MDNLLLNALKDVLGADKFEELMKSMKTMGIGSSFQDAAFEATRVMKKHLGIGEIHYHNVYKITCLDSSGGVKWQDEVHNLVVNEGLLHTLDVVLGATAKTATWYIGLTNATPVFAAANTMVTHAGWTENVAYAAATRPALAFAAAATNSIAATQVSFAINGTGTAGGAFITSDNAKSGTTGLLYGGNAFNGGNKAVDNGDTLNVDVTVNATST